MTITAGGDNPLKVLVGLEIHQQLSSGTKLFCSCPQAKSEQLPYSFERRLRPAQSELGKTDPAAIFEFSKGRSNMYMWSPESSCLVEADEEPPHAPSDEALDSVIVVTAMLKSRLVDEIHVMRKIVIDGSNTSGFQRTMVMGLGGSMDVGGTEVGVQSVTLEEDAARILGEDDQTRRFALDRLGVPLVEIALEPVRGDPEFVAQVALHLGRVLRSTGKVARGLGTIRQDLNVSVLGGNVVEVKGVQKLNLLAKVVEYETKRQTGLVRVSERIRQGKGSGKGSVADVTDVLKGTSCAAIAGQMAKRGAVFCVLAPGLAGLLGWEPFPGIRLGKEVAEVARANSLGGVVHSDEFGRQGISDSEAANLRRRLGAGGTDALVLVAGPKDVSERAAHAVSARLESAREGVPAETRAATDDGETRYMRPRPGSQRMYPETDVPVIAVAQSRVRALLKALPEDWERRVQRYVTRYALSRELALKIYDLDSGDDFERLSSELKLEPSLVASSMVELPVRLSREGVPEDVLTLANVTAVLRAVESKKVAKEAVPEVLRAMGGDSRPGVAQAIASLGLSAASEEEIATVIDSVVELEASLVSQRGEGAFSPIMGDVMKRLRGRADGALVGRMLREKLALRANRTGA